MLHKLKALNQKKEILIFLVLGFAFLIRNYVMITKGVGMSINSDDQGYIKSAIDLLNTGVFSYHRTGVPTVHIMPGLTFLLATIFYIFGTADLGLYVAKSIMILCGMISIYGIYLIGKYIHNIWTGLIAALFLSVSLPHIVTDNLILTEAPFTVCFIYVIYFSIRLVNNMSYKSFYFLLFFYIYGLMLRPTIALIPLVLLVYFLIKKYPMKLMVRQSLIAAGILIVVLTPWWVRNYIHFHEFIPLSGSSGDPLLLGTFQGAGFPDGNYDQVITEVKAAMPIDDAYYELKYEGIFAKERMKVWWDENPTSMLKSYLLLKPVLFWKDVFYWISLFSISEETVVSIHRMFLWLGSLGAIVSLLLFNKKRQEIILFILSLLYFTILNSYYFAYGRYTLPLEPFVYLGASLLVTSTFSYVRRFVHKV